MELDKYALKSVHDFLQSQFKMMGFRVIDLLDFSTTLAFEGGIKKISVDRIHLTPEGSTLTAEYIYRQLLSGQE